MVCCFKHSRSVCEGRCLYTYVAISILMKRCLHYKNLRVSKLRVGQLGRKLTEFVCTMQSCINVKALLCHSWVVSINDWTGFSYCMKDTVTSSKTGRNWCFGYRNMYWKDLRNSEIKGKCFTMDFVILLTIIVKYCKPLIK